MIIIRRFESLGKSVTIIKNRVIHTFRLITLLHTLLEKYALNAVLRHTAVLCSLFIFDDYTEELSKIYPFNSLRTKKWFAHTWYLPTVSWFTNKFCCNSRQIAWKFQDKLCLMRQLIDIYFLKNMLVLASRGLVWNVAIRRTNAAEDLRALPSFKDM